MAFVTFLDMPAATGRRNRGGQTMRLFQLAALVGAVLIPGTCQAQGTVKSEKIGVDDVPEAARKSADEVAPDVEWDRAFRHSKEEGPTKLWYRLIGINKAEDRAFQVRVKPDGEVVDVWRDLRPKEVPPAVMKALERAVPAAVPLFITEVRQGRDTEAAGYRFEVEDQDGNKVKLNISADGQQVRREGR
jgi:hypothetical protein